MTSGQTWGSDFSGCSALVVVLFTEYQNFVKTLADSSPELTQPRVWGGLFRLGMDRGLRSPVRYPCSSLRWSRKVVALPSFGLFISVFFLPGWLRSPVVALDPRAWISELPAQFFLVA